MQDKQVSWCLQRLEQRELLMAEELRDVKERYVSLEASIGQILAEAADGGLRERGSEAQALKQLLWGFWPVKVAVVVQP